MILEIFTALSHMLHSSPLIALGGAFLWGILSILLSPCHLASVPLIVGFIGDQGTISTGRAALLSSLFSVGILITISLIGLITGLMGRLFGDVGQYGFYAVAVIMIVIGLYMLNIVPLPFLDKGIGQPGFKQKGLFAAFVLGLVFGIALGPCTFAYMAPMLGIAFSVASTSILYSVSLILFYAAGHCLVIVFAGTFTGMVQRLLSWNELMAAGMLKKVCGALVIIAGLYMIYISSAASGG